MMGHMVSSTDSYSAGGLERLSHFIPPPIFLYSKWFFRVQLAHKFSLGAGKVDIAGIRSRRSMGVFVMTAVASSGFSFSRKEVVTQFCRGKQDSARD